jgi:hypothetical protein
MSVPQDDRSGVIPRTLRNLFESLRLQQDAFTVQLALLELYDKQLIDLMLPAGDPQNIRYDHASEVICVLYLPEYKTTSLHNL